MKSFLNITMSLSHTLFPTLALSFTSTQEASMYQATQELQYLDMVIQETLRMYPAAPRLLPFIFLSSHEASIISISFLHSMIHVVGCMVVRNYDFDSTDSGKHFNWNG